MFFEDHVGFDERGQGFTPPPLRDSKFQDNRESHTTQESLVVSEIERKSDHNFSSASFNSETHEADIEDWMQQLQQLTQTERQCPDILPYPEKFMQYATLRLAQREKEIKDLVEKEKALTASESEEMQRLLPFNPSDVMELEMQRTRFFITEFLRCRLRKIESFCVRLYYEGMLSRKEQHRKDGWEKEESTAVEEGVRNGGTSSQNNVDEYTQALNILPFSLRKHLSVSEVAVADRLALAMEKAVRHAGAHLLPEPLQRLIPQPPYGEGVEILPSPQHETYIFGKATTELGVVSFGEGADQEIHEGDLFLVPYYTFRPYVLSGAVRLL